MRKRPLILISPNVESKGAEFGDLSLSLSLAYERSLIRGGGMPLVLPATASWDLVAEFVRRADGVLMTGGDDINPDIYSAKLPPRLRRTVGVSPDGGERDLRELMLIDEILRQKKPLLAICRGHQIFNVALGGTLIVDIPSQVPDCIRHSRNDKRNDIAHDVALTEDSLLAKITGGSKLGVNSTHHQAVGRLAEPLRVVARSRDGVVEATELKSAAPLLPFYLGVQFHPERLADRHSEHGAIFSAFARACILNRDKKL